MTGIIKTINGQKKIVPLTADAGAGNPVGTIIPMYKKSNPNGYLYCDGTTFDQTKYPLLYAYLGSNVLPDYDTSRQSGEPYSYIKATSGLTEGQQDDVANLMNEQRSYSTTEINTGKKWIDGKPIYRKVIDFGALPNATTKSVNHNISNLGRITFLQAITSNTGGTATLTIPYIATNDASYNVGMAIYQTTIEMSCNKNLSSYNETFVTLEYTKTTD